MDQPTHLGAPGIAVPRRTMRCGRFLVSDDLLHELLKLPAGCRVTHLTFNHAKHGYELSVVGDESSGLPLTEEGCEVALLTPWYKTEDGVTSFDRWS